MKYNLLPVDLQADGVEGGEGENYDIASWK
jgi:hypothetical protein